MFRKINLQTQVAFINEELNKFRTPYEISYLALENRDNIIAISKYIFKYFEIITMYEECGKNILSLESEKKLKDQEMLPETKAILFNIFRDYLSTEEENLK